MKVKKIACLLTALVISASAAMVPAVANAAAGEEVTVSSTTSYVEKEGGGNYLQYYCRIGKSLDDGNRCSKCN